MTADAIGDRSRDPRGLAARRIALEILLRVDRDRAFADVLLGHRLRAIANPADRRLVTQLVLGTIAWQLRLDFELAQHATRPLAELDSAVRTILRMGLYQLRLLTRIPAHAVVDTAVHLTRAIARRSATSGFVNAVLRSAIRTPAPTPDRAAGEAEYLAIICSHPHWMVERFIEWFGVDAAEAIMNANNAAAPTAIRLNLSQGVQEDLIDRVMGDGMTIARRGIFPETLILDGAASFDAESFRAGLFTPQSEASQIVGRLVAPSPGATIVDCAAAPGGKSTHLAELTGARGRVIALDRNATGLKNARLVARRLGHRNIHLARCDVATALPLWTASADYVLLDAPCTGLGTLREHPEIRWRLAPDDFARMARVQAAMLENAAMLVAPAGVLVYAVCSLAPPEGAGVINDFLERHPAFTVDRESVVITQLADLIDADGFLRTRPDRESRDGFFAARLIRSG
ncbi:MAG TPA: 16S rRNA (cytosine(967)-C(5))-methyltransferase RsmB [Candidatus Binataceae bacterium]|nr:16S rRNA (cytosine(967)-C(5))-methyltransferase RsmB [Candidatus Binataceae bacterium]